MRGALLTILVGCSSANFDVSPSTDASVAETSDSARVDDTATTTDGDGDGGGRTDAPVPDAVRSDACVPTSFPTLLSGCAIDLDCDFGLHLTDCCGNEVAIAFAASEKSKFEVAEAQHRAVCPALCDCPVGPIATQSGMSTSDKSRIAARCNTALACKSYVR
jgi:hypothetical protein